MGVLVPSLVTWLRHLPTGWFMNWYAPQIKFWLRPFNQLASGLGLPQWESTLDFVVGDLTLVMDAPQIVGLLPEDLESYQPLHPRFFCRPPGWRYGAVPMQMEQAGSVSLVVRQGAGVMLSMLDLNPPKLSSALEKIVACKSFRDNMRRLKRLQDPTNCAAIGAKETVRFLSGDDPH